MGILHSAAKTLLIVTLSIAPVIADEHPASTSTKTVTTATGEQSATNTTRVTKSRRSSFTSRRTSAAAPQQMFFSASGDKSSPAEAETAAPAPASAPAPQRRRMKLAESLPSDQSFAAEAAKSPVAESVPELAADTQDDDAEFSPAVFESTEDDAAPVRTVAAEEADVAVETAADGVIPELSFEESFGGEAAETDVEEAQDPQFDFNVEQVEPEEIGAPARELFDNAEPPQQTAAVVPNTESDSLPSEHTGAQQPAVEVHWTREGSFNIGQECSCALIVTNTGGSLVRNVTVEAAIPDGVQVISAVPRPQQGSARWMIGDLQAGQSEKVDMVMIPTQRGDIALNAFVRFTGYSTSVFAVLEPMLQMNVQGPDTVTVGEQAGYMVRVENPGTGTAHNVVIEAQIPEGLQHRSGSAPRIHVGTLNPGESRQARLNLTALEGGDQFLTVSATADGGLSDEARTAVSIAKPSLAVAINGPETAAAGEASDYEVTVTNTGNIPSINVRAKYRLPDNSRFVRADRGGVHHKAERLIDWFVGTIQPGESASYRVTLAADAPGEALHRAGVVSEHTSVRLVSHSTLVQETPELYLDVATAAPAPAAGDETVVRIIVQNEGRADAESVGLSCELPSGLEFIGADGPSDYLAENGIVIFRSLDRVQAGGEAIYRIKARCVRSGDHPVRVRVGSPSLPDPVIGEGTVSTRSGE